MLIISSEVKHHYLNNPQTTLFETQTWMMPPFVCFEHLSNL